MKQKKNGLCPKCGRIMMNGKCLTCGYREGENKINPSMLEGCVLTEDLPETEEKRGTSMGGGHWQNTSSYPQKVVITGVNIGFFSLVRLMTQLMVAAIPAGIIAGVVWLFIIGLFRGIL